MSGPPKWSVKADRKDASVVRILADDSGGDCGPVASVIPEVPAGRDLQFIAISWMKLSVTVVRA
jgi:hypothetical protein